MLISTHFSMNKGQSDRQRWKGYTYLHLTAAHMHDQPPGLPLLRHNMHALDLRRPSTLRRESQLSLRAGQHGSILNLPTPALHVGERSASLPCLPQHLPVKANDYSTRERGRLGRFTTSLPSLIDRPKYLPGRSRSTEAVFLCL